MRYLDTGSRDPDQALGTWLQRQLASTVIEVRWQSGFFTADGLGLLAPTLQRLAGDDRTVKVLIGSNNGATLQGDILQLLALLEVPRAQAYLGIVSYTGGAFFHPKTYHLRRADGSQCAYIGSANLTAPGVTSLHIEAGVVLDTRDGDSNEVLDAVAAAVDEWFIANRDGFHLVTGVEGVDQLVTAGVLALVPPPRVSTGPSKGAAEAPPRPRLRPLINVPPLADRTASVTPASRPQPPAPIEAQSVPRTGFPEYLLFDPNANSPTSGSLALSGAPLPSGAIGLIVRLNRDSARRFVGGEGTANISVPVDTATTFRFGIYPRSNRPRAEFDLLVRYFGQTNVFSLDRDAETNVMAYGVLPEDTGHGDLRMLVPAAVGTLVERVRQAELPVPAEGDVALLEWPSATVPQVRLTLLERGSPLYQLVHGLFDDAAAANRLIGRGACWLPSGVSPPW